MRYARLLLWILFVVVFLVYLTAIKLVRGDRQLQQLQQQQHFLQPYFGHTYSSRESDFLRQAREFPAEYVTFEQAGSGQQLPLLQPASYQQQQQSQISRRQHIPQSSPLQSVHPFVAAQNPGGVAQSKKFSISR